MALPNSGAGAVSNIARGDVSARRRWAPPTLGVTFDPGHVLVLAWEELREQAVSVNEIDYLGGLGRTVKLSDRLQGGERWVNVWRLCGCSPAGM